MEQIFTARNEMEAHFVQALLEEEEIDSVIQGEALEGVWGDMPVSDNSLPGIWVNEADVARAQPIIAEYQRREKKIVNESEAEAEAPRPTWKCAKCGEEVEEQFDECWNCGAAKPGMEIDDPNPPEPPVVP